MQFISLFAGIGGFDLALERAGMNCAAQVEIDPAARSVLAHHYPDVRRFEDVKKVSKWQLPAVELICGGSPCQDVSVAGRGAGLAGERSGLFFQFVRLLVEIKPQWFIFENVPGLLSSNRGRDFGVVLNSLAKCGYGVAYRILDAQYFGAPQRRRRVFIVGHLGDGRAAEVLFERESGSGDTSASIKARKELARDIAASLRSRSGRQANNLDAETGIAVVNEVAATLSANSPSRRNGGSSPTGGHFVVGTLAASGAASARPAGQANEADFLITAHSITTGAGRVKADGADNLIFNKRRSDEYSPARVGSTLAARDYKDNGDLVSVVKIDNTGSNGWGVLEDGTSHTLGGTTDAVAYSQGVRRLTPTECERLQGFPDAWTFYGADNRQQSDSARYKQLGNAVAVPNVEWIARRIMLVNSESKIPTPL